MFKSVASRFKIRRRLVFLADLVNPAPFLGSLAQLRKEVEQALTSLKSAPLIQGYRGRPEADLASAVDAVMAIQQYAISEQNRLVELDINPLLLCAKGEGVYAADALIVLQQEE